MKYEVLLYQRIRNLRQDRGLTQADIAKVLNVRQNTYSQYEIGAIKYPLDVLIKLAQFYETSIDYLLERTDCPTPYPRAGKYKEPARRGCGRQKGGERVSPPFTYGSMWLSRAQPRPAVRPCARASAANGVARRPPSAKARLRPGATDPRPDFSAKRTPPGPP